MLGGAVAKTLPTDVRIWDGATEIAVGLGDAGTLPDAYARVQHHRRVEDLQEQLAEAE